MQCRHAVEIVHGDAFTDVEAGGVDFVLEDGARELGVQACYRALGAGEGH